MTASGFGDLTGRCFTWNDPDDGCVLFRATHRLAGLDAWQGVTFKQAPNGGEVYLSSASTALLDFFSAREITPEEFRRMLRSGMRRLYDMADTA